MLEISEFDKIHNYVTWPDRERKFFPNGDVTIGALGFPVANQSGVANDDRCECEEYEECCADGVEHCSTPPFVGVEFNVSHVPTGGISDDNTYIATKNVDISYTTINNSDQKKLYITVPVKKVDYDRSTRELTVSLFDNVHGLRQNYFYLVKREGSCDSLATTELIQDVRLDASYSTVDAPLCKAILDASNSFDLPELTVDDIDSGKFALRIVMVSGTSGNSVSYLYLTNQNNGALYGNGVYEINNDTVSFVASSLNDTEMLEPDRDALLSDGRAMDNVGTCCGPHFRKTYSHDEIHDYVNNKVGTVTGFGVYSDVSGCRGALIDWLTSSGIVDIGNHKGFPVYVNGFGLGSFFVGQAADDAEYIVNDDPIEETVETMYPWMCWSFGTTKDERASTNVSALPRDWPFTNANDAYNRTDDVSIVTLVKRGVTIDGMSETVGNLYSDIHDEEDPTKIVAHRFYNKHHFVLNQKYKREAEGGYEVKPLFINLPAPLDTEDGETYEITVSIQNQSENNLGEFVNEKDLSAYYAAMSQPRVYVMGGFQQFSNKKLLVTVEETYDEEETPNGFRLTTNKPACSIDGEPLPTGTQVRANVVSTINGYTLPNFNAFGTITQVEADGNVPSHTIIECTGKFPSDRNYHRDGVSFYICGMAYLRDDDNPSTTRMGLVRDDGLFRGKKELPNGDIVISNGIDGSGEPDAFDQYNTFFSINKKEGHRALPHIDRRYYLASVYQTATNTFPWRFNNRRKLQRLDRVASDITRKNGIINMVYDANRTMLNDERFTDAVYARDGKISLKAMYSPVSYAYETELAWENLATVLRVALPSDLDNLEPITKPYGNPVRQAAKAMKNFTTDLYNMRMIVQTEGRRATEVATKYLSIRNRTEFPSEHAVLFDNTDIDYNVSRGDSIRTNIAHSTLRSLPQYIVKADLYESNNPLYPSNADSVLFTVEGDANHHGTEFFEYYNTAPYISYGESVYASVAATEENECDLIGTPASGRNFSNNSVIESLIKSNERIKHTLPVLNDMRRYADVGLRIKISSNVIDLTDPDDSKDWYSPFTNLSYKDGAPSLSYNGNAVPVKQQQWFAFDAVQTYRFMMDDEDDPVSTISTRMPYLSGDDYTKSKALASFIEKYVTGKGAGMPTRFYKGRRVELKDGTLPGKDSDIYINEIYRVQKLMEAEGCTASSEYLTHYLNDNFEAVSMDSRNPNADAAKIGINKYALDATVPPYAPSPEYTNAKTYTRVRMQFTFSQKAGRWYTTEYRQYPCCYLSPLYGNDALSLHTGVHSMYDSDGSFCVKNKLTGETSVNDEHLWRNSACMGFTNYRSVMYAPYSSYPPMDITLGCVPYLYNRWPYGVEDVRTSDILPKLVPSLDETRDIPDVNRPYLHKLEQPWLEYQPGTESQPIVDDGGISLYPPANVSGGHEPLTDSGIHANFWTVRAFVRPATSILANTHVPKYEDPDTYDETIDYRKGGLEADPTLYRMFDFPKSGEVIYQVPDVTDPSREPIQNYLLYHGIEGDRNAEDVIRAKSATYLFGYGVADSDQTINES